MRYGARIFFQRFNNKENEEIRDEEQEKSNNITPSVFYFERDLHVIKRSFQFLKNAAVNLRFMKVPEEYLYSLNMRFQYQ